MYRALPMVLAGLLFSLAARATGYIETPQPGSNQSGIGVVSGWHCTAERIQVLIDDYPPLNAGARTERNDTIAVCGRADTGYSLLFNFNLLDPTRRHRIVALADGVEFARVEFTTRNLGADYLTGRSAAARVLNFPNVGESTALVWSEDNQNFLISHKGEVPPLSGVYFGADLVPWWICAGPRPPTSLKTQFDVTVDAGRLTLEASRENGTRCTVSASGKLDPDGYFRTYEDGTRVSSCIEYNPMQFAVNGERLTGTTVDGVCFRREAVGAK